MGVWPIWLAFIGLLALAAAPIFSTELPPLVDYPNHLARMHLLAAGGSRYYAVQWAALPNLAEDLLVPPLGRVMPLDLAAKLFLVATFALPAGGTVWLNRIASGRWLAWPLLGFLLLYSRTFLWGFLNYLFGLGCALCGAALWLTLENRPAWLRIAVSTTVATVCFFSHLAAWSLYLLTVAGIETPPAVTELRSRAWRGLAMRLAILAPQALVPAAILFFLTPHAAGGGIHYAGFWRKADLLFSVFDNYSRPFDIACFAAFIGLFVWLAAARRLRLDRRLGCALGLVCAAYLLLPSQLLTGSGADHRLPVAIFLLLVAASAPSWPSRRAAAAAAAIAGLMLAARLGVVEVVWRHADHVYRADIAGIDTLPSGARVAVAYPPGAVRFVAVPQLHLATLAVARRGALVPDLFALPGQQPVAARPPYAALAPATSLLWSAFAEGDRTMRPAALHALAVFDAVVFTGGEAAGAAAEPCLTSLFRGPGFAIFSIAHRPGCAG